MTNEPDVNDILALAAIIREVDGNHDKGAAALAEAILSHRDIHTILPQRTSYVPTKITKEDMKNRLARAYEKAINTQV